MQVTSFHLPMTMYNGNDLNYFQGLFSTMMAINKVKEEPELK